MNIQYLADVISSPVHNNKGTYKRSIIFFPSRITPLRDFSLRPRCKWDLYSSKMLLSVVWQLATYVSAQPIGPIFKGQINDCLTIEAGTNVFPETSVINGA